ncbi:cell wall-binding repeat-containing protein [Leifsonia sp. P73]|uniref:cell wall-binding repeat-containing protein n=1 Tax=Leifsonia sp. P73 TaxID=3423959 RepID=UPI003DA68AE3
MVSVRAASAALAVVALAVGVFSAAAPAASAAEPPSHGTPVGHMGDYAPSRFAGPAAELPRGLADAVQRDLGLTPTDYLSRAAAAQDAGRLVAKLKAEGVHVADAQLDGTRLSLRVTSAADVAVAQSTGAQVTVGQAPPSKYAHRDFSAANSNAVGGTAWGYLTGNTGIRCSIGFNGVGPAQRVDFVTAGHCVAGYSGSVSGIQQAMPSDPNAYWGPQLGNVAGTVQYGGGSDTARVNVTNPAYSSGPAVSTWGGGASAPEASQLAVRGDTAGVAGAPMCKSGSSSGWTCGTILAVDTPVTVGGQNVNAVVTSACVIEGDSGGAALVGSFALGTTSGSSQSTSCGSGEIGVFFPMVSAAAQPSVTSMQPDWELGVGVSTPTTAVPSGGAYFTGSAFTGTVAGADPQTTVAVYWDGRTDAQGPSATTNPDSSGAWSVPSPAVGTHSYRIRATWGAYSKSPVTSGTVTLVAAPAVSRISGSDRFDTSVQVSKQAYPNPGSALVVVVASGMTFPDALSAGPAAVKLGGPLLLTGTTELPSSVSSEIQRLAPPRIIVVGGTAAVSDGVFAQLQQLAPRVQRVWGADRYETSRAIVQQAFGSAGKVYFASGGNFPDALSSGAAAGSATSPVVLVPGVGTVDSATAQLVSGLHASTLDIVGGTAAISDQYASSLSGLGTVQRLQGADRFATAQAVNQNAFASSTQLYLASSATFPDALSGSALAGVSRHPLYIGPATCIPQTVVTEVGRLGATGLVLVGGAAALGGSVAALTVCSG